MKVISICIVWCLMAQSVFAGYDGEGKVTALGFAGVNFGSHADVVQFELEGGFTNPSCNTRFAAVRKDDAHLVSALLSAKMSGGKLQVLLDPTDIYYNVAGNFPNRCVATFLVMP